MHTKQRKERSRRWKAWGLEARGRVSSSDRVVIAHLRKPAPRPPTAPGPHPREGCRSRAPCLSVEWHHHRRVPGQSFQLAHRGRGRHVDNVRQDRPLAGGNRQDQPDPRRHVRNPFRSPGAGGGGCRGTAVFWGLFKRNCCCSAFRVRLFLLFFLSVFSPCPGEFVVPGGPLSDD